MPRIDEQNLFQIEAFRQESGRYVATPVIVTGTSATPAPNGQFYYIIRALSDAVIASAKDLNGDAVSGLAAVALGKNDPELHFTLSDITLTSGSVVLYLANKMTSENQH